MVRDHARGGFLLNRRSPHVIRGRLGWFFVFPLSNSLLMKRSQNNIRKCPLNWHPSFHPFDGSNYGFGQSPWRLSLCPKDFWSYVDGALRSYHPHCPLKPSPLDRMPLPLIGTKHADDEKLYKEDSAQLCYRKYCFLALCLVWTSQWYGFRLYSLRLTPSLQQQA